LIRTYPLNEQEARLIASFRKLATEHREMLERHAAKLAEPATEPLATAPNVHFLCLTAS
jgi:hypothetical protein